MKRKPVIQNSKTYLQKNIGNEECHTVNEITPENVSVQCISKNEQLDHFLNRASNSKNSTRNLWLKKYAVIYFSSMILISLLFGISGQEYFAFAFLVLSVPLGWLFSGRISISAGLKKAAEKAVFFRNGSSLKKLAKIDGLIFNEPEFSSERKITNDALQKLRKQIQHLVIFSSKVFPEDEEWQAQVDQVFHDLPPEAKKGKIAFCSKQGLNLAILENNSQETTEKLGNCYRILFTSDVKKLPENFNLLLTNRNLKNLAFAHQLSCEVIRNQKQNVVFSVLVSFLLPLGLFFGQISLNASILIEIAAIFLIFINGFRIRHFPKYKSRVLIRLVKESFYFPSVWAKIQEQKANNPYPNYKDFKQCSEC